MQGDDVLKTLSDALLSGKIDEAGIKQVLLEAASGRSIQVTDIIHLLFCSKDHSSDCGYYSEIKLDSCWAEPSHDYWLSFTKDLMKELEIEEARWLESTARFSHLASEITRVEITCEGAVRLLKRWLESTAHS